MDVDFVLDGEPFSWDAEKEAVNVEKHGSGFAEAAEVFFDDFALDSADAEHSEGELRETILGQTRAGRLLRVVHTERWQAGRRMYRLISARPADKKERATYERSRLEQGGR